MFPCHPPQVTRKSGGDCVFLSLDDNFHANSHMGREGNLTDHKFSIGGLFGSNWWVESWVKIWVMIHRLNFKSHQIWLFSRVFSLIFATKMHCKYQRELLVLPLHVQEGKLGTCFSMNVSQAPCRRERLTSFDDNFYLIGCWLWTMMKIVGTAELHCSKNRLKNATAMLDHFVCRTNILVKIRKANLFLILQSQDHS